MYQCSKKLVTCKEHCCFDHSDFPAHSMFTFDVCWGSFGASIFGNASNTRSRLPSRLSFRFLWLWYYIHINKQWCSFFLNIFWNYTRFLEFYYVVTLIHTSMKVITWCIYMWSPLTQKVIITSEDYPSSYHESYYQQRIYTKNESLLWTWDVQIDKLYFM